MTDKLPQEVAEAIEYLDRFENCPSGWTTVRAYIDRLADENARLKARIAEAGKAACRSDGGLVGPSLIAYMAEEDVGKTFALLKLEDGE